MFACDSSNDDGPVFIPGFGGDFERFGIISKSLSFHKIYSVFPFIGTAFLFVKLEFHNCIDFIQSETS